MNYIEIPVRGLTFEALVDGPEDGCLIICFTTPKPWEWHHQIPAIAELGLKL